jgi:hypothetical protein
VEPTATHASNRSPTERAIVSRNRTLIVSRNRTLIASLNRTLIVSLNRTLLVPRFSASRPSG